MRMAASLGLALGLVFGLASGAAADRVFVSEPYAKVRPAPGLARKPFKVLEWGESYDRVKDVGQWARIRLPNGEDAFVWSHWVATYERVADTRALGKGGEIHFLVGRLLGAPVLEAMCRDILDNTRERSPELETVVITGYLRSRYPEAEPLCEGHWSVVEGTEGTGGQLEIRVPEERPLSGRDEEIYEWLVNEFHKESRGGESIFEVESLWVQAGARFGIEPEEARYAYDRVRWSKTPAPNLPGDDGRRSLDKL